MVSVTGYSVYSVVEAETAVMTVVAEAGQFVTIGAHEVMVMTSVE